jgi:hypothetical protein
MHCQTGQCRSHYPYGEDRCCGVGGGGPTSFDSTVDASERRGPTCGRTRRAVTRLSHAVLLDTGRVGTMAGGLHVSEHASAAAAGVDASSLHFRLSASRVGCPPIDGFLLPQGDTMAGHTLIVAGPAQSGKSAAKPLSHRSGGGWSAAVTGTPAGVSDAVDRADRPGGGPGARNLLAGGGSSDSWFSAQRVHVRGVCLAILTMP